MVRRKPKLPILRTLARRDFLRGSAAAGLLAAGGGLLGSCAGRDPIRKNAPKIAIVGAGIAGLHAAYRLKKAGYPSRVYEADTRVGGRIFTMRDLLGAGLATEMGAEFIDTGHEDMLQLSLELGLNLIDLKEDSSKLVEEAYFFDGRHRSVKEVIEEFSPVAAKIKEDVEAVAEGVDFQNPGAGAELDRLSIAEYLDRKRVQGWLRKLLDAAFVTEFGLEAGEQSCLNLLTMISTDVSGGKFELFGESDERYKVEGGNLRIPEELARRLAGQIELDHRLTSIRGKGRGCILSFDTEDGDREVEADWVVLALPFTLLRSVEMKIELPKVKQKAIAELGYGLSTTVMAGVSRRVWNDAGYRGSIFTDEGVQLGWDNSQGQPGPAGGFTYFLGGAAAERAGAGGTPEEHGRRLTAALDKPYPGSTAALNNKFGRWIWPKHPFSLGGYSCYKPGQWTTICGAEIQPVGRLLFAGEHCSLDYQGFMNGGAETGRRAAEAILAELKG
jgi:monoamine oxidase